MESIDGDRKASASAAFAVDDAMSKISACRRIAFFGHFGGGNLGNECTLQATLDFLRRCSPGSEFLCICTGPELVTRTYGIPAIRSRPQVGKEPSSRHRLVRWARRLTLGVATELHRWAEAVTRMWGTDVLIVPGTGLLSDAYTLFGWGPYDMFRWSLAAKLCRSKLLFVSVGAGPVTSRMAKFFVKTALSLADFRSYRDDSTREYLAGIGLSVREDRVCPDLAFSLSVSPGCGARANTGRRPVVGVGVMSDPGRYSAPAEENGAWARYRETLLRFTQWLLEQEYDVRLLVGDVVDVPAIAEFKWLLKARVGSEETAHLLDEPADSVESLLSQLAETDFVVATRFHNALVSLALNKPVITLSFHPKCSSLMKQMGISDYCQPINGMREDMLIEQFRRLRQNAELIKRTIAGKVQACRRALDEQYVALCDEIWPDSRRPGARVVELKEHTNSSIRS